MSKKKYNKSITPKNNNLEKINKNTITALIIGIVLGLIIPFWGWVVVIIISVIFIGAEIISK
ncbi:hypothetical protein [Clostridium ihumii]|uniref:hypothetical protein n=1 Tax=Clostridium ihumii TaxID=1470356 RepID=UPI003D338441